MCIYKVVIAIAWLLAIVTSAEQSGFQWDVACGQREVSSVSMTRGERRMIVGGQDAQPGEVPWQVSLRHSNHAADPTFHFCGAVLIHKHWILTAAHCVQSRSNTDIAAILGEHNGHMVNEFRVIHYVSDVIIHPSYNQAAKLDADIALLRLTWPVTYNERVQPVCAPRPDLTYEGTTCVVSGWGTMEYGTPSYPATLQRVNLPVLSNTACQQSLGPDYTLTQGMVCAGNIPEYSKDACQNDSGGPMTVEAEDGGHHELVGLVSWGKRCAGGSPGVFTRVSYYLSWIQPYLKDY